MVKYTAEHLEFLKVHYQTMLVPELTEAFNKCFKTNTTKCSIRSTLHNHKIRCGRKTGKTKGRSLLFAPEQVKFIKENYPLMAQRDLAAAVSSRFGLNISEQQIKTFTSNHHILSGRTGCFEKGHASWNKDTKGLTGRNPTSFKTGHKPVNWRPAGSERVNAYGYAEIKLDGINPYTGYEGRWYLKHVLIWEKENGPVPDGHVVLFRDGNKLNCQLGNLVLVSRAELVRLNKEGYSSIPPELKPSVLVMAKLKTKLFERMREVEAI